MEAKAFIELLKSSVIQGVVNALNKNGLVRSQISPAEAYRLYGRSNVERWLYEGLIPFLPNSGPSSRQFFDKRTLEAVAAKSNRATYLPVAER